MAGKSVIIEMDFNSKLGKTYVKGDPNQMSVNNGKVLDGILKRPGLIVANGMKDKSSGIITRKRITTTGIEESVIDYVLISGDMLHLLVSCHIDSDRKHVLTKITKRKRI